VRRRALLDTSVVIDFPAARVAEIVDPRWPWSICWASHGENTDNDGREGGLR
jgi:hypothetical protein